MEFKDLVGKTLVSIENCERDSDEVYFKDSKGKTYVMFHYQDCCESVYLADVCGDVEDLLNSPILLAEESTSEENPEDARIEETEYQDCFEWTFYKLATIKGSVTLRWYGDSNGYYSTSVSFRKLGFK